MLNITIVGDRELVAKLDLRGVRAKEAVVREVTSLTLQLERKVKAEKLSGQVLNVRTGNLRASIHSILPVEQTGGTIRGRVASSGDVKYAGIHEFGGKTPAHVIMPVKANALAFMMGGKMIFAKKVNHPGSTMPERSFLRSALKEMAPDVERGLNEAIKKALT